MDGVAYYWDPVLKKAIPVSPDKPFPMMLVDGTSAGSGTEAFAHETVLVSTTAIGLDPAIYADATSAFLTIEGDVRAWFDGSEPTNTEGHPFDNGDIIRLNKDEIAKGRFIRSGSADVIITATYYR